MKYDFHRMLRLEGAEPTAREHWNAFYRAWRASVGKNPASNVIDAWWVLGIRPEWIKLMNEHGDLYDILRHMPRAVRLERVKRLKEARRRRFAARLLHAIMHTAE